MSWHCVIRCVHVGVCLVVSVWVCIAGETLTSSQAGTLFLTPRTLSHRGESCLQAMLSRTCSSTWFRCFTTSLMSPSSVRIRTSITCQANTHTKGPDRHGQSQCTLITIQDLCNTLLCRDSRVVGWGLHVFIYNNNDDDD